MFIGLDYNPRGASSNVAVGLSGTIYVMGYPAPRDL